MRSSRDSFQFLHSSRCPRQWYRFHPQPRTSILHRWIPTYDMPLEPLPFQTCHHTLFPIHVGVYEPPAVLHIWSVLPPNGLLRITEAWRHWLFDATKLSWYRLILSVFRTVVCSATSQENVNIMPAFAVQCLNCINYFARMISSYVNFSILGKIILYSIKLFTYSRVKFLIGAYDASHSYVSFPSEIRLSFSNHASIKENSCFQNQKLFHVHRFYIYQILSVIRIHSLR